MSRPVQTERNERILEMYNQGMKQKDISKEMGLTVTTVSNILRSMPEYKRRGTDKADKVSIKAENDDREAREELQYLNMLDKFTKAVVQINNLAADGEAVKQLRKKLQQISPAFLMLVQD